MRQCATWNLFKIIQMSSMCQKTSGRGFLRQREMKEADAYRAAAQIRLGSKVLERDGSFERTQSWHPPLRFKCVCRSDWLIFSTITWTTPKFSWTFKVTKMLLLVDGLHLYTICAIVHWLLLIIMIHNLRQSSRRDMHKQQGTFTLLELE